MIFTPKDFQSTKKAESKCKKSDQLLTDQTNAPKATNSALLATLMTKA
jgi:hypothetical protein